MSPSPRTWFIPSAETSYLGTTSSSKFTNPPIPPLILTGRVLGPFWTDPLRWLLAVRFGPGSVLTLSFGIVRRWLRPSSLPSIDIALRRGRFSRCLREDFAWSLHQSVSLNLQNLLNIMFHFPTAFSSSQHPYPCDISPIHLSAQQDGRLLRTQKAMQPTKTLASICSSFLCVRGLVV